MHMNLYFRISYEYYILLGPYCCNMETYNELPNISKVHNNHGAHVT
jgi:hypothetical protein